MRNKEEYDIFVHKIIFIILVLILFLIIQPIITILLTSIILAYISYPVYNKIKEKTKSHIISALSTITGIILVISIPFSYILYKVIEQSIRFYQSALNALTSTNTSCINQGMVCTFTIKIQEIFLNIAKDAKLESYVTGLLQKAAEYLTSYIVKIPPAILSMGIALILVYFILKDGEKISKLIIEWLPMRKKTTDKLLNRFKEITFAVVFGQIIVALAQGFVAGIGFYLFGVPFPILLGAITALAALLPVVGSGLIWVPASVYLILAGYLTKNYLMVWKGFGLLVYGIIVISHIDNILRAKILEKKAKLHPLITIIGVIGGVYLFGVMGLFIGPIVLALIVTYLESFKERFKD